MKLLMQAFIIKKKKMAWEGKENLKTSQLFFDYTNCKKSNVVDGITIRMDKETPRVVSLRFNF